MKNKEELVRIIDKYVLDNLITPYPIKVELAQAILKAGFVKCDWEKIYDELDFTIHRQFGMQNKQMNDDDVRKLTTKITKQLKKQD